MKILFFDDERERFEVFKTRFKNNEELTFCQNFEELKIELDKHISGALYFDIISFDHDIYDAKLKQWLSSQNAAQWFVEMCPKDRKPKIVIVHSVSEQGRWALYHIFSKLTKTWQNPFRLETAEEILLAAELALKI